MRTLAFPVIGAGSGGFDGEAAFAEMLDALAELEPQPLVIRVVRFAR